MTMRKLLALSLVMVSLSACNATVNVPAPTAQQATAGTTTSARSNFEVADTSVKAQTAADLTLYRCEFDEVEKIWIYFYYSPSQNKSYKCKVKDPNRAEVVEVTEADKQHQAGSTIDKSKWNVDSTQVQTIVNQTVNVNVTNNVTNNTTINNLTLISAEECKARTGKDADGPVWVAIVNNVNTYISANTGTVVVQVPAAGASPMPTTAPSATPSVRFRLSATAMPAAALSLNLTLTGAAEVPPVTTTGTGTATVTLNAEKSQLMLTGSATGLSGPITGAHIHRGTETEAGPVVKGLVVSGETFSVTWSLTDADAPLTTALIEDLLAGRLYVNVHTEANPNGELRAQIKATAQ